MIKLALSYKVTPLLLALAIIGQISATQAQRLRPAKKMHKFRPEKQFFRGFDASFGQFNFKSESNFGEISRDQVQLAGGQVGFILGTAAFRTKVGVIGYYSSVSDIAGTIDLYQSNISNNFYPLALLTDRRLIFNPYVTAGVNYNRFKLYGYYLPDDSGPVNYSVSIEKSLGTLKQFNATFGTGFEINVLEKNDFVHLYSEVIYARNFSATFDRDEFRHTEFSNQWLINVGVRYGLAP